MKCGAQIAAAAAGGYLLGRSRKMKWALLLGSAAAGRAFGTSPGDLVEQGTKTLRSPELTKLSQTIGGPLAEAGKAAAIKAASTQMESLTDRLNERAESLRQPSTPAAEAAPEDEERQEEGSQGATPPRQAEESSREEPASRRQSASARGGSRTGGSSRTGGTSRTGRASASGTSRSRGSSGSETRQRTASASRQAPRRQQRRSSGSSGGSARRGEGDSDG